MKLKIKSIAVLIFALLLSACSTVEEFIIVNNSNAVLNVEYRYKSQNLFFSELKKISADNLMNSDKKWRELSVDEYQIDEKTKTVKAIIAPHEALIIEKEVNYRGHDSEESNIEELTLSGINGTLEFEGKQAQTQFEKQENGDYMIFYK